MAVRFQAPKVLGPAEMFLFWMENIRKEKPHLIIKYLRTTSRATELWYEVKEELNYLQKRNAALDERIQFLEITDRDIKNFTAATTEIFEMKKEIMNNKYKIKDLEKLPPDKKQKIMDFTTFKNILVAFNTKASEAIIRGGTLSLTNKLGYSQIRKIIPMKRGESIDWGETMKYKQELLDRGYTLKSPENPQGKNWLIYRIQDYYLRWSWVKHQTRDCTVKNNRVYAFYATSSSSSTDKNRRGQGNKSKLCKAQLEDDLLHTRYAVIKMKEVKENADARRAKYNIPNHSNRTPSPQITT